MVRREVYRRVQERFRKEGIEFAHRNVTVYLPPEVTGVSDVNNQEEYSDLGTSALDKKLLEAGAAAVAAVSQDSETEQKFKK